MFKDKKVIDKSDRSKFKGTMKNGQCKNNTVSLRRNTPNKT